MLKADYRKWPIKDVEEFEDRTGGAVGDAFRKGQSPRASTLVILYELARRQDDPKFTAEDAANVPYGDVVEAVNEAMLAIAAEAGVPLADSAGTDSPDGSPRSVTSTGTRRAR